MNKQDDKFWVKQILENTKNIAEQGQIIRDWVPHWRRMGHDLRWVKRLLAIGVGVLLAFEFILRFPDIVHSFTLLTNGHG